MSRLSYFAVRIVSLFNIVNCLNLYSNNNNPDYDIIYLKNDDLLNSPQHDNGEINYRFVAFGRPFDLKLSQSNILSPNFKSFLKLNDDYTLPLGSPKKMCHYIHKDDQLVAAISTCDRTSIQGLLFMENDTFELNPLNKESENLVEYEDFQTKENMEKSKITPHIVKRASLNSRDFAEDYFSVIKNGFNKRESVNDENKPNNEKLLKQDLTLEVALFFDEAAYKIFSPYMNYDDLKLQDMILAYLNGVQALYHHPSLGQTLDIVLVRLEIMKSQPSDLYHYNGQRSELLDSFCSYQSRNNPQGDDNPDHWDMALYVSGLDFFAYENGRKNGATMGLATVGGVCLPQYNCIIAELGATNTFGKPYPSAGFTSVYILAHEIGHNLGMHHDSSGNNCAKEGYIMSPSRGTNGETQWSSCSAQVMSQLDWADCLKDSATKKPSSELDHKKFFDNPGRTYTAKKQCEILLRDRDAVMAPNQKLDTICYNLQCKTPHRSGFYHSGPALDGTQCGNGKYCYGGECVKKSAPTIPQTPGGWSPWVTSSCSSYCLQNSLGYQTKKRFCNKPEPRNTDQGCIGPSYEVKLCNDQRLCNNKRRVSSVQYAADKCKDFAKLLPELDETGGGLQAPHEELRLWMGCSIFCKRKDTGGFFTPRIELNDLGVSPYFPDGTWCHNSGKENYYCLQNHCLPESFSLSKISILDGLGEDIPLPQNARPFNYITPELQKYLSLDNNGKPLKTFLRPGEAKPPTDEEWDTKDYVELPQM